MLHYNLGAAPVAAKGTTLDYLAHPSEIPGQIMARRARFSGVVKAGAANKRAVAAIRSPLTRSGGEPAPDRRGSGHRSG